MKITAGIFVFLALTLGSYALTPNDEPISSSTITSVTVVASTSSNSTLAVTNNPNRVKLTIISRAVNPLSVSLSAINSNSTVSVVNTNGNMFEIAPPIKYFGAVYIRNTTTNATDSVTVIELNR